LDQFAFATSFFFGCNIELLLFLRKWAVVCGRECNFLPPRVILLGKQLGDRNNGEVNIRGFGGGGLLL